MDSIGALSGVALECPDPPALAEFYSRLTGWPIVYTRPDWCSIGAAKDASFHLSFQLSPGHQQPTWPDPASSMQLHLHVRVADLDVAEAAAIALGATSLEQPPGTRGHRVLADPAGHPFCLCRAQPRQAS